MRVSPRPVFIFALLLSAAALAQVELVDPDTPAVKKTEKKKPALDEAEEAPVEEEEEDAAPKEPLRPLPVLIPKAQPAPEKASDRPAGKTAEKARAAEKALEALKPAAPVKKETQIIAPSATDASLQAAWEKWRSAKEPKAEADARNELLRLREEVGGRNFEAWAVSLQRAAMAKEAAGDATGAIDLAVAAVQLAPQLPASHFGLARVYAAVDPADLGRILGAALDGLGRSMKEPRSLRAFEADVGGAFLTALVILAMVVMTVLFLRRIRYFLYDFHFFFPRVLQRWQSAAIALLVLALPIVFRMGVAPALLAMFGAVALYLTLTERLVAGVLIGLLGVVPLAAEALVDRTSFASSPAERVWVLEQGAPGAEAVAAEVARRVKEDKASYGEVFALGSFQLRRGRYDEAIQTLKIAVLKRSNDGRAANNLGVAMLLSGDIENPRTLFEDAANKEPTLAAPLVNLARLYQRRTEKLGESAIAEVDKANAALASARERDRSIGYEQGGPPEKVVANQWVQTLPLAGSELSEVAVVADSGERVRSQLAFSLLGDVPEPVAFFYPFAGALLLLALGFLGPTLLAAKPCNKCGSPVSVRGDPDLAKGSPMCTACINVFARKGVVPAALKVRKQLDVDRYQTRLERFSYALGLLCSGMGHVFNGLVVRGTLYAFLFLLLVIAIVQRYGLVRAPFEAAPLWLRLIPLGVASLLVYLLTLRSLFKKQGG